MNFVLQVTIKLSRLLVKGERILKLAEMCRKLQTEEEKVLPFYASSLTADEQEDIDAAVAEEPSEPLAQVSYILCSSIYPEQYIYLYCGD